MRGSSQVRTSTRRQFAPARGGRRFGSRGDLVSLVPVVGDRPLLLGMRQGLGSVARDAMLWVRLPAGIIVAGIGLFRGDDPAADIGVVEPPLLYRVAVAVAEETGRLR